MHTVNKYYVTATQRNIPEDSILHGHNRENLKILHFNIPPPHV
jgi:hypothetical protein